MLVPRPSGTWSLLRVPMLPARIDVARLQARTGRPVVHLDECDSTNLIARQRARVLLQQGDVRRRALPLVVAEHQLAGRGRLDRRWRSLPRHNLLFSLILGPDLTLVDAPRAVLAWAAALAETLDVSLKWPNDLVDGDGHKLGGVLAEHEPGPDPDRVGLLVLGVGVNVLQTEFPRLPQATSLARLRPRSVFDRTELMADLVRAVDGVDLAAPDLLERWRARDRTIGRRVRVGGVEGVATGIRDDGALLVDGRPVLAGDVELIGAR
ncbi:MAG: biotin--[acetyl-CoA-carboxylase] ligase [Deltaproteobacteria bacterium]|nr:MAG: biotin--[acetyl-CoA-carboxylase] ligase [Deltaproteobacteria bacterium]